MFEAPSVKKIVLAGCMVCAMVLTHKAGTAQNTLSEAELFSVLSGKTWIVSGQSGPQVWIEWRSDGTYCLDTGSGGENNSRSQCGTWQVKDEKFCMLSPSRGVEKCLRAAAAENDMFDAIRDDDSVEYSWSLAK